MTMPPPWEPLTVDAFFTSWPMAAEKCELHDGVVVWYGAFNEDDRQAAERAFPGRVAVLAEDGAIELRPGPQPTGP